jgi:preprotein translocase subunit SecF
MRQKASSETIAIIAIILAFVLMLIVIWLWYDLKIKELDSSKGANISMRIMQIQNPKLTRL